MKRGLLALNVVLVAALCGLWWLDDSLESRFERKRRSVSMFLPLAPTGSPTVAEVARLELTIPGSNQTWAYERRDDGWHLPQYRDGFGRSQEIEGILKALLDGKGTIVGRVPSDAAHFGLETAHALQADLFGGRGDALLRARVGRVAPGGRQGECYMMARGSDLILHMDANARAPLKWTPGEKFPPLLDVRVTPLALGRRSIVEVSLRGSQRGVVHKLERREVPEDPQMGMRGPTFEWYGTIDGESGKRLNDQAAFTYTRSLVELTFDELLGTRAQQPDGFDQPGLTVTVRYDGEEAKEDTLTLGARTPQGLYRLHHSATDQVFLISATKRAALEPDGDALQKENPKAAPAPPSAPGAGFPPGAFPGVPR